jgi:uncharacterized membrane protein YvlD (DUF360 family)
MTNLLVTWLLSAVSLLIVAHLIKGFDISGFGSALIAAVVIGLANGTIGFFLKVVTFPLTNQRDHVATGGPLLYLASRSTVFFRP